MYKHFFILPTDFIPCILFCYTLLGPSAHFCDFFNAHFIRMINQFRKAARLTAPIQGTILCHFLVETDINQQIQICAAESFNQRRVSAANRVSMARSQYLTIVCSEIFQYFRIGADHLALIHSCPSGFRYTVPPSLWISL